jgi:hypothetical protein
MVEFWRCPHCGASNEKTLRQGPIVDHKGGNQIVYQTSHPDNCPKCGHEVGGAAILSGRYDDHRADIKDGLKQGLVGLAGIVWFIGAFWLFPFAFKISIIFGVVCVLIWISPIFLSLRRW